MFQILGQAAANSAGEASILASARSFQPLNDSSRLNPTAARLRVMAAPRSGTLAQIVGGLGTQGVDLEEIALINGMDASTTLAKGRLIKTVTPGRMR
jgi:predicted Zn-dependent protease